MMGKYLTPPNRSTVRSRTINAYVAYARALLKRFAAGV